VGFGAVIFAGPAAGLFGLVYGLALGEGGGLALAGTESRVELTAKSFVLGLQLVDPSLKGLAAGTSDRFHARIIRSSGTCSCTDSRQGAVQLGALIKYSPRR
jgi:hypothetical protein